MTRLQAGQVGVQFAVGAGVVLLEKLMFTQLAKKFSTF